MYKPLALCMSLFLGYALSSSAQITTTFSCAGIAQYFTVPPGVTSVQVDVVGGPGGWNSYEWFFGLPYVVDSAGHGGRVQATLTVVPGTVLQINVGNKGANGVTGLVTPATFGGGGSADWAPLAGITANIAGGAGGGASDIRVPPYGLGNREVVAGGGGGAGSNYVQFSWPSTYNYDQGGDGGGTTGAAGLDGLVVGAGSGGGGTPFAGGAGGFYAGWGAGAAGTAGVGGYGGGIGGGNGTGGGGGGGGYYGGGGASWAGGGGGSSYANPVTTSAVTHTQGYNAGGCGWVMITIPCTPPTAGTILGPSTVCVGSTITLSDPTATPPGTGTWSSSAPAVGSISAGGVVTGLTPGTTTISYTTTVVGCGTAVATLVVTVNPIPVGGTVLGAGALCPGSTLTLTDPTGTPGGTWSSSAPGTASVVPTTGLVTGGATPGTATITYTITNGCGTASASAVVTVNSTPPAIVIPGPVCLSFPAAPITFTDPLPGGTWSSGTPAVGTIDPVTGDFTPLALGTTTVTYSAGGCSTSTVVTVNPLPAPISGPSIVCRFQTITLTDPTPGGTWSSSVPLVATVGSSTGIVTGVGPGLSATLIQYILPTGCAASQVVSISPPPSPITGPNQVCESSAIMLIETTGGGTWTSSSPSTATVTSGIVTGLVPGTVVITYSTTACPPETYAVTVNPLPAPITGLTAVCVGMSTTLYDATPSGVWSSSDPLITVSPGGVVTSTSVGISGTIYYTLPTGCFASTMVNVSTPPTPITRPQGDSICLGSSYTFTSTPSGGVWSTTDLAIAPVIDSSGIATGIAVGNVNISYTLSNGCYQTAPLMVAPNVPASVSVSAVPGGIVCAGTQIKYTATTVNGGTPTFDWQLFSRSFTPTDTTDSLLWTPTHGDAIMCVMVCHGVCAIHDTVSDTFVNNVYPMDVSPIVTIRMDSTADTFINYVGQEVTFFTDVTWGGSSPTYQWYNQLGPIFGATNSSYTTFVYVTDTFWCVVDGNPPCRSTPPVPGYSNKIVIHNYLGVQPMTIKGNELSLFPNPNNGSFTLSGTLASNTNSEVTWEITNMLGQTIANGRTTPKNGQIKTQISVDGTAAGSYLLRVNTDNGVETFHFVIGK